MCFMESSYHSNDLFQCHLIAESKVISNVDNQCDVHNFVVYVILHNILVTNCLLNKIIF